MRIPRVLILIWFVCAGVLSGMRGMVVCTPGDGGMLLEHSTDGRSCADCHDHDAPAAPGVTAAHDDEACRDIALQGYWTRPERASLPMISPLFTAMFPESSFVTVTPAIPRHPLAASPPGPLAWQDAAAVLHTLGFRV